MADSNMTKQPGRTGVNGMRRRKGHGPGGPGGKMMPGEKAKDFKGNHEEAHVLSGSA